MSLIAHTKFELFSIKILKYGTVSLQYVTRVAFNFQIWIPFGLLSPSWSTRLLCGVDMMSNQAKHSPRDDYISFNKVIHKFSPMKSSWHTQSFFLNPQCSENIQCIPYMSVVSKLYPVSNVTDCR